MAYGTMRLDQTVFVIAGTVRQHTSLLPEKKFLLSALPTISK